MTEENFQKNPDFEKCEKERDEYLNGWKRAKADLINYQKDEAKRFEEIIKFANTALIKDLIAVLDSFDLAERHNKNDAKTPRDPRYEGLSVIENQFEDIMKKNGLERMPVSIGNIFDPNLHESIGEVESDKPPGAIIEEVERGYLLNGRVIRPARVKISKVQGS